MEKAPDEGKYNNSKLLYALLKNARHVQFERSIQCSRLDPFV